MVTVLGSKGYLGSVVLRRWLELGDSDHVVNCIRPDVPITTWYYAERCDLIQPSTDAIAEDSDYARTKRIVELAPGAVIIRAGIVDIRQDYPVGYMNWWCNPLTPLEWADYAWAHRNEPGLHVTGREPLSRYKVAEIVAEVFGRQPPVPRTHKVANDRLQKQDSYPPLREALETFRAWL